jgi:hypothetical protein
MGTSRKKRMQKRKDYSTIEGCIRQSTNNPVKQLNNADRHDSVLINVHSLGRCIRRADNVGTKQKTQAGYGTQATKCNKGI